MLTLGQHCKILSVSLAQRRHSTLAQRKSPVNTQRHKNVLQRRCNINDVVMTLLGRCVFAGSARWAIVEPTCRHYVGPTYINVSYNVRPTLALHNFNVNVEKT